MVWSLVSLCWHHPCWSVLHPATQAVFLKRTWEHTIPSLQTHEQLLAVLRASTASSVWLPSGSCWCSPVHPFPRPQPQPTPGSSTSTNVLSHLHTWVHAFLSGGKKPAPISSVWLTPTQPSRLCSDVPPLRRERGNYHVSRTSSRPTLVLMLCYI